MRHHAAHKARDSPCSSSAMLSVFDNSGCQTIFSDASVCEGTYGGLSKHDGPLIPLSVDAFACDVTFLVALGYQSPCLP